MLKLFGQTDRDFTSNGDRLWRDGRKTFCISLNTTGDVTILAEGTKIILEAF